MVGSIISVHPSNASLASIESLSSNAEECNVRSVNTRVTDSSYKGSNSRGEHGEIARENLTLPQRYASSVARYPIQHLSATTIALVAICVVVATLGNLDVKITADGWLSRGTLIANREAQVSLLKAGVGGSSSDDTGSETQDDEDAALYCSGQWYGSESMKSPHELYFVSMWRTGDSPSALDRSALDADVLYELCVAEEHTLKALEEQDLCHKCPLDDSSYSCLQPYSLVLLARQYLSIIGGDLWLGFEYLAPSISCESLRSKWTSSVKEEFTATLRNCATHLLDADEQSSCTGLPFTPATLVDQQFPDSGIVKLTSSIYATKNDDMSINLMYQSDSSNLFTNRSERPLLENVNEVGINSVYTTARLGFYERYLNQRLPYDVAIALGSTLATSVCILIHTRSVLLTVTGLLQIVSALPCAYAAYYFIFGLHYFGMVHLIAIFIVFSLGADDIFVAVDKWKRTRSHFETYTTEQVAVQILPETAQATLVTSLTTSVSFFAGAVIKVPQVKLFLIYCGLLVAMDYILSLLLLFPAICLHDRLLMNKSRSGRRCDANKEPMDCSISPPPTVAVQSTSQTTQASNVSQRALGVYYEIVHKVRWVFLLSSLAAIVICAVLAASMRPPLVTEPSFLPQSNPYEMHRNWARELLLSELTKKKSFGQLSFTWGLLPVDNGFHLNPDARPSFAFDPTFDLSSEESQIFVLDFCDKVSENNFTRTPRIDYKCSIQAFNEWLKEQARSEAPLDTYVSNCRSSRSIPVQYDAFGQCIIAFANAVGDTDIHHDGVHEVMALTIQARSNTTYQSPLLEQAEEWKAIEMWVKNEKGSAPEGTDRFFFSSRDFHVYDTLQNMLSSAYKSILIALICASAMILMTSRSINMMLLSVISISYVLVATGACLVGLGWTLGMFESVLIAIMIGIACDYVLHFSHAYTAAQCPSREAKTRSVLNNMGPSVLGSAATTLSTGLIMLLTENVFCRKFGVMLVVTTLHSVIGSFVVFLSLCDCIGFTSTSSWCKRRTSASPC